MAASMITVRVEVAVRPSVSVAKSMVSVATWLVSSTMLDNSVPLARYHSPLPPSRRSCCCPV